MKKIISILLCVAFVFCLASCQEEAVDTKPTKEDSVRTEPIASFQSVTDFKVAIKKSPEYYKGKTISVKGYVNIRYYGTELLDDLYDKDEYYDGRACVGITFDSSTIIAIDKGDYVEVSGIVNISQSTISLGNCTYKMITPHEEEQ